MDENEVIAGICAHLIASGCHVEQRLHTTERGIDIIAREPESHRRILIEAKGGTSSRIGSERYGRPYTQTQVFDRAGKGIFTALKMRADHSEEDVLCVLATPDTQWFRMYLAKVALLVKPLGIEVWLLSSDGSVSVL